jgi:hypothetical protein
MARPLLRKQWPTPPPNPEQMQLVSEVRLDGGMNTYIDPADLPGNQLVLASNCYTIADQIRRSKGTILYTPTAPNSDPVLLIYGFQRFDLTTVFLRFTKNKIHRAGVSSWTEITSATPYSILDTDRIRVLPFNNRLFFVTGKHEIFEINFTANTYAYLGNAGKYKYITGFFNRVVGANLYDASTPNPTLIAWSGDINFTQWNPATDISAGSTPLLEAASDFADPITGLFGFASVMLILRERSLWIATKRPVASNPFQFQAAYPSVGCDCPNTAASKRNGLVWFDYRSKQVYDYTIGQSPRPVGDPVIEQIEPKIGNKETPIGNYNPITNEYTLTIPGSTTTITYAYTLNLNNGSWTERTIDSCQGIHPLDGTASALIIDELSGTINSLAGTINSLSNTSISPPAVFYAMRDGTILVESSSVDTDNGATIATVLESKTFVNPDRKLSVSRFRLAYKVFRFGSMLIEYWNGNSWFTYKTVTLNSGDAGKRLTISCVKHILGREFKWRVTSTSGDFSILHYSIDFTTPDTGR